MKATIAKRWVKALRSKKYKQGRLALKAKNKAGNVKHCCLGVLCELYQSDMRRHKRKLLATKTVNATAYHSELPATQTITEFDKCGGELPALVMKWAGMSDSEGRIVGDFEFDLVLRDFVQPTLAELNDHGFSFSKIADIIETYAEDL